MQSQNFITVLSLLFVAEGSASNSFENETAASGDGSPMLSTITVTPPPAMPTTYSTTVGDHEYVATRATEYSFETKSTSTELNTVSNNDSLETAEQSILIYVVPIVLLVLLILLIMFFVIHHKRKKSKQDELGSENVKSPIFEEDTPSVMEIEMEELDKWMNSMNKNAECECLPTVREEEKESIANPRTSTGEVKD
ncbi:transmembrane protein 154 isoform X2 [Struthio camelus]|uniref:transmembrane protein 154 isoform X2 n=1 Tax=Struthio camelus TaxID=8801 RepID=UPI00051E3846|nr:PREDICTED: transmembrane protein 154 isoform X1 [Struthio camelus australis]